VDHVVNKTRHVDGKVWWWHLYDNPRVMAVYNKSISFNPLTPFDLLWICHTAHFYSWQHFDRHSASCSSSAVAGFLVVINRLLFGDLHRWNHDIVNIYVDYLYVPLFLHHLVVRKRVGSSVQCFTMHGTQCVSENCTYVIFCSIDTEVKLMLIIFGKLKL